jgi:hypothetical protein
MRPPVGGHGQKVFHGRLIVASVGEAATSGHPLKQIDRSCRFSAYRMRQG